MYCTCTLWVFLGQVRVVCCLSGRLTLMLFTNRVLCLDVLFNSQWAAVARMYCMYIDDGMNLSNTESWLFRHFKLTDYLGRFFLFCTSPRSMIRHGRVD